MTSVALVPAGSDQDVVPRGYDPDGPPVVPQPAHRPLRTLGRYTMLGVVLGLAGWILLPQVGQVPRMLTVLGSANPWWLAAAAGAAVSTFLASTVSMIGAAGGPLPLLRTAVVEVAAAAANRLTPAGLGRVVILSRYYRLNGRTRAQAATATGVNVAAGGAVHTIALAVGGALFVTGSAGPAVGRHIPSWPWLLAGAGGLLTALLIAVTRTASRWRRPLTDAAQQFMLVARRPRSAAALIGGSVALNAAYILTLAFSVIAVGGHVPLTTLAFLYLAGSAAANATPVPAGLGVMDAALVAGLTTFGVAPASALAGVLLYRFFTYWLPLLPGLWCLHSLKTRNLL